MARRPRVLVVEDDPPLRKLFVRAFERVGFEVQSAEDGVWALCWVLANRFDLILTDVMMPRLDGLGAIVSMRERDLLGNAGLIVLSANDFEERAAEAGADLFFKKPVNLGELIKAGKRLARVESGSERGSARLARKELNAPEVVSSDLLISGPLEKASLGGVLQMIHGARRSGRLYLEPGVEEPLTGAMLFAQGELLDAKVSLAGQVTERGEPAITVLSAWTGGSFRFHAGLEEAPLRTIHRPTPRIVDELTGAAHSLRGRKLGRFEILGTLSRGLKTTVYRGRQKTPKGRLAARVTTLSSPLPDNFDEHMAFRAAGFAPYWERGVTPEGEPWVAAGLPRGPSLEEVVAERPGGLDEAGATDLALEVLKSLARLHAAGLHHGGLNARRVILPPGRRPQLLDHGLTGSEIGSRDLVTLHATAPEICWTEDPGSPAGDLYAVGVLLHLALRGDYPFRGQDPHELAQAHLLEPPYALRLDLPTLDPRLERVERGLLAKTPADRLSVEAACALLEAARSAIKTDGASTQELGDEPREAPAAGATSGLAAMAATATGEVWEVTGASPIEPPGVGSSRARAQGRKGSRLPPGYRYIERLGAGAAGVVIMAEQEALGRRVAIKTIHPKLVARDQHRERFVREARLAARLDHPNVVRVFDAGEHEGTLFLVMELIEGESLQARIAREGAMTEDEGLEVCRQILAALAYAHGQGVVHRDLKPDNLMITERGVVKLTDFGLAREIEGPSLTLVGKVVGTPLYMSPEQIQGLELDGRADLYSLGATLYHLLTGRPPFEEATLARLVGAHLRKAPPDLNERSPHPLQPSTRRFVARLLAKGADERFGSAEDALSALSAEEIADPDLA